ncbi:MAG: CRISPR-associated helicase Cas3' [Thermogemmata sp.]|uniref:CRISPR-associated helicase Cas3 n=1 Tax=Thermogemmata fonticola TaxID=2755323 RepID=A0A7V9ACU7_9BACT|nr:CRISPR-associated helicase Cas3' [Thermogemmata fonticola]MBA2227424.1 CRISPR-associated helicase Cas3' [Thermogemmata fonticola]
MLLDAGSLWAKSGQDRLVESMRLPQHLRDVYEAAGCLLDSSGADQLRILGLNETEWRDRFRRCLLLAAAVHDLGKANDHFQQMIRGQRDVQTHPQGLRHEWVTVLLLQQLRHWLMPALEDEGKDWAIVEWAVGGHHPAEDRETPPTGPPEGGGCGPHITFLTDHPDFTTILEWLAETFHLAPPPHLCARRYELIGDDSVFVHLACWHRQAQKLWRNFSPTEKRLLAAVKAALVAADVAGSALPFRSTAAGSKWSWILHALENKPSAEALGWIVQYRLRGQKPRPFQEQVAQSPALVTLVQAGCGTGKTLAAYLWAQRRWPGYRLYFCYPTTGTATEGFRDYLFPPDLVELEWSTDDLVSAGSRITAADIRQLGAGLFHSRRDVDWDIILTTGRDAAQEEVEAWQRRDALEAWSTPIVACTVDTVLGLMQNHRRALFAWPALAQSAFIFDEIHAYDDKLFQSLLRFISEMVGAPMLLMTASLPRIREQALRDVLQRRGLELLVIQGPPELENRPRYHRLSGGSSLHHVLSCIQQALQRQEKVLWVVNTVGRAMQMAQQAESYGLQPILYHSRFKYQDRVERHRDVIDAFRRSGPALCLCTQVAEMSLDLSADLLVSDLAPIAALIQRLGRLNRRAAEGDPTRPFLILEPDDVQPYTPAELEEARRWLDRLPQSSISQRDLVTAWQQNSDTRLSYGDSTWLDGGPKTEVKELRQGTPGINVLLRQDYSQVQDQPRQLARYVLPLPPPRSKEWKTWPRFRGVPIAPDEAVDYDPRRGAQWREQFRLAARSE